MGESPRAGRVPGGAGGARRRGAGPRGESEGRQGGRRRRRPAGVAPLPCSSSGLPRRRPGPSGCWGLAARPAPSRCAGSAESGPAVHPVAPRRGPLARSVRALLSRQRGAVCTVAPGFPPLSSRSHSTLRVPSLFPCFASCRALENGGAAARE